MELDTTHTAIAAWLAEQSRGVREDIELALDLSAQSEALEPSRTAVHITEGGPPEFESNPLRIPLNDARRFLDSPFVILLEDSSSDRAFLERMMTDQERDFLQRRISAGTIRIEHGGGTGPMTRRVQETATAPMHLHTMWVLFDSDAMQPGLPSADSERLRIACGQITYHQLRRRYIESYLTLEALENWANVTDPVEHQDRKQRYQAFREMRDDQRHHYNMKHGFARDDRRTDTTAGTLYANLSAHDRQALTRGFGPNIGNLFSNGSVTEADLRRDTGWGELRPVLLDLLARIR